MNTDTLERAIRLGKQIERFIVALVGDDGFPYVSSARHVERVAANQLAIEEWFCPLTVSHLNMNPKIAVFIRDPATDDGYEVLGEVLMFESSAFLNGFALEAGDSDDRPQVKRRLVIRAERITAFSHAPRCDEIRELTETRQSSRVPPNDETGEEVSVCDFAPEWAEHARFGRDDTPCDDGRSGRAHEGGWFGSHETRCRDAAIGCRSPDIDVGKIKGG